LSQKYIKVQKTKINNNLFIDIFVREHDKK